MYLVDVEVQLLHGLFDPVSSISAKRQSLKKYVLNGVVSVRIVISAAIQLLMMPLSYCGEITSRNLIENILAHAKSIEEVETKLGSYHCEHTVTSSMHNKDKLGNKILSNVKYKAARNDDMILLGIPIKNTNNGKLIRPESISIYNSGDTFTVSRRSKSQAWAVTAFKRDISMNDYLQLMGISRTVLVPLTFTGLGGSIEELVSHPQFKFTGIKKINERIATRFIVNDFGKGKFHIEGTLTFFPDMKYIVSDYDVLIKFNDMKRRLNLQREVDFDSEKLHCSSLTFMSRKPHKQNQLEPQGADITTLVMTDYQNIEDDEFTLDYYKLPEPTDVDALPPPFYSVWRFWAVVAGVCTIGTFATRYLARRYSAT